MSKHISGINLTSTTTDSIFNANVGIGTNNPSQKLHVQGDALIQGGDEGNHIYKAKFVGCTYHCG